MENFGQETQKLYEGRGQKKGSRPREHTKGSENPFWWSIFIFWAPVFSWEIHEWRKKILWKRQERNVTLPLQILPWSIKWHCGNALFFRVTIPWQIWHNIFMSFCYIYYWILLEYSPKTEVWTLFSKFFSANILFWEHLGVISFRPKSQSFL